ncbi:MAG: hypothetical protein AAGF04_05535 [Chlamydiota bacterium]
MFFLSTGTPILDSALEANPPEIAVVSCETVAVGVELSEDGPTPKTLVLLDVDGQVQELQSSENLFVPEIEEEQSFSGASYQEDSEDEENEELLMLEMIDEESASDVVSLLEALKEQYESQNLDAFRKALQETEIDLGELVTAEGESLLPIHTLLVRLVYADAPVAFVDAVFADRENLDLASMKEENEEGVTPLQDMKNMHEDFSTQLKELEVSLESVEEVLISKEEMQLRLAKLDVAIAALQ